MLCRPFCTRSQGGRRNVRRIQRILRRVDRKRDRYQGFAQGKEGNTGAVSRRAGGRGGRLCDGPSVHGAWRTVPEHSRNFRSRRRRQGHAEGKPEGGGGETVWSGAGCSAADGPDRRTDESAVVIMDTMTREASRERRSGKFETDSIEQLWEQARAIDPTLKVTPHQLLALRRRRLRPVAFSRDLLFGAMARGQPILFSDLSVPVRGEEEQIGRA